MRIVGIDPGGSTGLAYTRDDLHIKTQVLEGHHHLELYDWLNMFQPDIICLESFQWQPRYHELISVEYIGVVHLWAETWKVPVVQRKPADAKGFITDEKLKRVDMWKGLSTHERDATRHLLAFLCLDQKSQYWIDRLHPKNGKN